MSDDLIKRSDAIKALGDEPMVWTLEDEYTMGQRSQWRADVTAIESIPSADRPQGEWIETDMRCYGATVYKCSVCGDDVDEMPTVMGVPKYRYCPNCGADMRERKESDR